MLLAFPAHRLSFRWVINGDDLIPGELAGLRVMVTRTAARVLGALSRINLAHVVDPLIKWV